MEKKSLKVISDIPTADMVKGRHCREEVRQREVQSSSRENILAVWKQQELDLSYI